MIPKDFITEWRQTAPRIQDSQVEQDLILSRALVEIFAVPEAREALAFRHGVLLQQGKVLRRRKKATPQIGDLGPVRHR